MLLYILGLSNRLFQIRSVGYNLGIVCIAITLCFAGDDGLEGVEKGVLGGEDGWAELGWCEGKRRIGIWGKVRRKIQGMMSYIYLSRI